ncbi:uncharacterized protein SAPINGB_P003095 [Magnusiomyces paraingens]|uniref:Multivesicular body sorting factor 12 domain-containing protein n=1 Tax=Magnusiomyces paraingens TaxID=2606893 RepID=A0A5E8BPJ3_9ASCO|nr:uncharacterized protein SAPINGB_P003095 [Saprochaete ingens]VVT51435.1 unnamed protein product [Saprochaete ingens]
MDNHKAHPILSQIPLIISPFLHPPKAVTLPFNFNKLPSALPASAVTSEAVDYISTDSQQFAEFVENQHIQRKQHYEQWINDVVQQDLREKRKIAPGYLDSTNRILQPVKVETKSTPEPERATLNQVNEIDKMFGKVEISSGSTPQSPQ